MLIGRTVRYKMDGDTERFTVLAVSADLNNLLLVGASGELRVEGRRYVVLDEGLGVFEPGAPTPDERRVNYADIACPTCAASIGEECRPDPAIKPGLVHAERMTAWHRIVEVQSARDLRARMRKLVASLTMSQATYEQLIAELER